MVCKKLYLLVFSFLIVFASNVNAETDKECFEKVSRGVFKFNQGFDSAILEPVAKAYNKLPEPIRKGTGNFTSNIATLLSIPNHILQGNFKDAGHNSLRFVINSTVGILGFVDVASWIGLEKKDKEDYGQTLGAWGVGPGCYLVLPILGPTTARDTIGSFVNISGGDPWYNVTIRNDTQYFSNIDYYTSAITSGIDFRAKNLKSIDSLEKNSIDLYAAVRSLYLQDRERKVKNSNKITETLDDSDWEEIDTQ